MKEVIEAKIKLLPSSPGVYVMLDVNKTVIYVGKAKSLKNRVTQYFRNGLKTEKVAKMVMNVDDFYYILTHNERDALSLENNLIKKYKPKYNILLKDDKSYPYIKIDLKEEFPCFTITRKIKNDGAKYFGPYMLNFSAGDVLDVIKSAYQIRPCTKVLGKKAQRECLNYHLGLCLAPCALKCSREDYLKNVKKAIDFLSGNDDEVFKILKQKMHDFAEREEFEKALSVKNRIDVLQKIKEKKITALNRYLNADVISIKSNQIYSVINVFYVRGGKSLGTKNYHVETLTGSDDERILEFLLSFYNGKRELPSEVILQYKVDGEVEHAIKTLYDKSIKFTVAQKGVKKSLIEMSLKNASEYLEKTVDKIIKKNEIKDLALERLKSTLSLESLPIRMECFDISHISGVDKVGSMVVFSYGEPIKSEYRRFKIKTVDGNNDFACLKEVLKRRLNKLGTSEEERFSKPNLIVIDGGKGQLSSVKEVFNEMGVSGIDLISLAEREEEIFTLSSKDSIKLDKTDHALKILQRLRDEAHRFAITFNRDLRNKRTLKSLLTDIEGIGKKKRDVLIDKFKDIFGLITASVEDIASTEGIGLKQAKIIKEFLLKNGSN